MEPGVDEIAPAPEPDELLRVVAVHLGQHPRSSIQSDAPSRWITVAMSMATMRARCSSVTWRACSIRWWSGFGPVGPSAASKASSTSSMASELIAWTETCQPASSARPIVAVRSAGSQLMIVAPAIVEVDLQPLDAEAVVDEARARAIGVPVAEELLVEVQGEIGVDAELQGVVVGEAEEQIELFLVDPLLGDRGPAARGGRVHGVGRRFQAVVVAVPDPVSVGIDEPGVGDVLPDVDDWNVVAGNGQHLLAGADRGHRAVLDEECLRDGRLVHGHDPADDDEAPGPRRGRLGAAAVAGEPLADEVGDDGELVLLGAQPVTRASTTIAADNGRTACGVVMGHLSRGDAGGPSGPCRGLDL